MESALKGERPSFDGASVPSSAFGCLSTAELNTNLKTSTEISVTRGTGGTWVSAGPAPRPLPDGRLRCEANGREQFRFLLASSKSSCGKILTLFAWKSDFYRCPLRGLTFWSFHQDVDQKSVMRNLLRFQDLPKKIVLVGVHRELGESIVLVSRTL